MNFVERIINEIEREEQNKSKTITGDVEMIIIRVTGEDGRIIPAIEKRIVQEINGREVVTSSFVSLNNAVYFIALCKNEKR